MCVCVNSRNPELFDVLPDVMNSVGRGAGSKPVFSQQAAGWDPGRSQGRRVTDDILTLLLTSSHSLSLPAAAAEPADC